MSEIPVRPFRMFLARVLGGPHILVQVTGHSVGVDLDEVSIQVAYRRSRNVPWQMVEPEVVGLEQVIQ